MGKIKVSAPGKLMLFGEYAVLENFPCIVTAVNKRLVLDMETTSGRDLVLNAPLVGIKDYKKPINNLNEGDIPKGARFVETTLFNLFKKYKVNKGLRILTSGFPSKYGFGSSAAVSVCIAKAVSELFGLKLSNKEIFEICYKTVLDVQGKASGFDIASSIYGGTIYFQTGGKIIEQLSKTDIPLVVGYSGKKADTSLAIKKLDERFEGRKKELDDIYAEIGATTKKAKYSLEKSDYKKVGKLMNENQIFLDKLGINTKKLNLMISGARDAGAYGSKLSGAGMGDCMIALSSLQNKKIVEVFIENNGGEVVDVKTNEEGVRVEL